MQELQLEPEIMISFLCPFIFAEDITAIIFPCRKAWKPHLGSASHCVRYCSNRVPAPDSLKAKRSSQTEGGKGMGGPKEARRWHSQSAGPRSASPLPPLHKSKASDSKLSCPAVMLSSKAQLRPSWLQTCLQSLRPARILWQMRFF